MRIRLRFSLRRRCHLLLFFLSRLVHAQLHKLLAVVFVDLAKPFAFHVLQDHGLQNLGVGWVLHKRQHPYQRANRRVALTLKAGSDAFHHIKVGARQIVGRFKFAGLGIKHRLF